MEPGTLRRAFESTRGRLRAAGIEAAESESGALLSLALGCPASGLWARMDEAMDSSAAGRLEEALARREKREPLQYILGSWDFMGLAFRVSPQVLIPRPETESLAAWGLDRIRGRSRARILDLGSGCGALLGSLLALGPASARGLGVDRSEAACRLARENLKALGLASRAWIVAGDWGQALASGAFDLILANPPYLDPAGREGLMPELSWEPQEALFAGEGGRADIRKVIKEAESLLRPGAWLGLETGSSLAEEALGFLGSCWNQKALLRDLGGRLLGLGAQRAGP